MRFLVITKANTPIPPQAGIALFDAMLAWVDANQKSGKMEQTWSFAGIQGGGGILNVDSLEELDAIMIQMPFAPFSSVEVLGLVDVKDSLAIGKKVISQMMQGA